MNMKNIAFWISRVKNIVILVFIPIIFTFIFGLVYSKVYVEEIPLVVLDMDNTSLSRNIVSQFDYGSGFSVEYYASAYDEMEEIIKTKKAYAGLVIPKNFYKDVKELAAPKVLLVIDETNIVIGNNAMSYGGSILNSYKAMMQMSILESNGIVPYSSEQNLKAISFVERILYDPQMSYLKYIFLGFIGIFMQQTYLGVVAPILINEKYYLCEVSIKSKLGRRKIYMTILRVILEMFLTFVASLTCLFILGKVFGHPLRGSILYSLLLQLIFVVNLTGIALVLAAVFEDVTHCVQFLMFLTIPTFLTSGYIWPEYMMPEGFGGVVKMVWPLIYYINPMRYLHLKEAGFGVIHQYISGGITFAVFWLPIGVVIYLLKILTMKKHAKTDSVAQN